MAVSILHLTDLHQRTRRVKDIDEKAHVTSGSIVPELIDRLATYLRSISTPDFVAITGDFTIGADQAGFNAFLEWVEPLIRDKVLPPTNRFIVTPGNHDVVWPDETSDANLTETQRFERLFRDRGTLSACLGTRSGCAAHAGDGRARATAWKGSPGNRGHRPWRAQCDRPAEHRGQLAVSRRHRAWRVSLCVQLFLGLWDIYERGATPARRNARLRG